MKTQFVPYEQALALKELGFDDKTLKSYDTSVVLVNGKYLLDNWYNVSTVDEVKAPLYQQAFKFFRDKHELYYTIEGSKKYGFAFFIYYENDDNGELKSKEYSTYEEAEQECLIKLIEITKEKK